MPAISVFTCSFNKPQYVGDAIRSVFAQTCTDWEYFVIENSTDDGVTNAVVQSFTHSQMQVIAANVSVWERKHRGVESLLKNTYTPRATGKYLFYLADDDVLAPTCFETHLRDFHEHPDHRMNYHYYYIDAREYDAQLPIKIAETAGSFWPESGVFAPGESAKGRVDGGAAMFERVLLDAIPQPWWKLVKGDAHIHDGLLLNRLMAECNVSLYPIKEVLHTKRITPLTTHREAYGRDIIPGRKAR